MLKVFKHPVPMRDAFDVDLPEDAQILTVQVQRGNPQMWYLCDPEKDDKTRYFRVAGTGHPILETIIEYIGTFQIRDGKLVFHLFEIAKEK